MATPSFIDVLRTTVAALQAAYPERLGEIARAHASIIEGHVMPVDAANGKVLSRNGSTWYTTNGHCNCTAGGFGKPCRHLSAWKLFKHVQRQYDALQSPAPALGPAVETEAPSEAPASLPSGIDPRYVVLIQGKPFVKMAGLLSLAHQRGLQSLETTFTYNDAELSLAQSTATFPFGVFTDVGDASPSNTNPKVRAHFRRVSATRAAARALRQALNIAMVALEELADGEGA